jgi:O-Antigen ligase
LRLRSDLPAVAVAAFAAAAIELLAVRKLGVPGLLAPVALVLVVSFLRRPLAMVALVFVLAVLCEGQTFGFANFTSHLYDQIYKGLTPLDILVVLATLAVVLDAIVDRRALWVPRPLVFGLTMLVLAMMVGVVTGHAAGTSIRSALLSENVLAYLLVLPVVAVNVRVDRATIMLLLGTIVALAIAKAALGIIEVVGHYGASIEGSSTLTYYEPAANWLIMLALLGVIAAVVMRARPPLWMLACCPLLIASILLSYRRSFWIASVLGVLLVVLLGTSSAGRRLLLPAGLGVAAAIWLLGSTGFQSQLPVVKRVESIAPTSLRVNAEDRYRLDERANVFGEIRHHPVTGLGVTIPWEATVQPLSVEHENGRQYVHFAALWFWLKLGILGLVAYLGLLAGAGVLAWRVWRRSREPLLRAFGLASLCGLVGLVAIETTASFTGVDARFTVLLGVQIALLALLDRTAGGGESALGERVVYGVEQARPLAPAGLAPPAG